MALESRDGVVRERPLPDPNSFTYLAFEGGGGKGGAYLGALAALADQPYWPPNSQTGAPPPAEPMFVKQLGEVRSLDYQINDARIRGISGSSAGAITAVLLGAGYTLKEVTDFSLDIATLASFYDKPRNPPERPDLSRSGFTNSPKPPPMEWKQATAKLINVISCLKSTRCLPLIIDFLKTVIRTIKAIRSSGTVGETVLDHPFEYSTNLWNDYGFFSGRGARTVLDKMIARKTRLATQTRGRMTSGPAMGATFREFQQIHPIRLILTGTNIATHKGFYFSERSTPEFRVVDALRISIGFPLAFKPLLIEKHKDPRMIGCWIDGGIVNNLPLHAFDDEPEAGGMSNPRVLGLRLDRDHESEIKDFGSFMAALMSTVMSQSELGQIRSPEEAARTIALPIPKDTLSTLDFTPPREKLKIAIELAYEAVVEFFTGHKEHLKDPRARAPVYWTLISRIDRTP